jgi:hypothetical protein
MSNSDRAEVKQVITNDLRSIIEASIMWRKSSSASNGNFEQLSVNAIQSRLPSNMSVDAANGLIYSSGLRTGNADKLGGTPNPANGQSGPVYTIHWDFNNRTSDKTTYKTGWFAIGMDTQNGIESLNWDTKLEAYAKEVFEDVVNEMSNGQYTSHTGASTGSGAITITCGTDSICFKEVGIR